MMNKFFARKSIISSVDRLYGEIMAAARRPALYLGDCAVPDTVDGRFDLLLAHAFVVLRRLQRLPEPGPQMAQALSNRLFAGFDAALREMGVGDLTVPKRMTKFAEAFGGRSMAYEAALTAPTPEGHEIDDLLAQALARNVYASDSPMIAVALARYLRAANAAMQAADLSAFERGPAPFPDLFHL